MKRDIESQIRARVQGTIDLTKLTPEDCVYAVLDRALLLSEIDQANFGRRFAMLMQAWTLAFIISAVWAVMLTVFKLMAWIGWPWWTLAVPVTSFIVLMVASVPVRHYAALIKDGRDARQNANIRQAIAPFQPPTPPSDA